MPCRQDRRTWVFALANHPKPSVVLLFGEPRPEDSLMPPPEKHSISFDASAKAALDEASGLPDLSQVTDEHDITTICMFFGSAAYYAQFFEAALADFLLTYRKLVNRGLLEHEVESLEEVLHGKALGALLTDLRKEFTLDDAEIDTLLEDARKKRNYLMHNFFRVREPDFPFPDKREEIFGELVTTGLFLKKAMIAVRGMTAGMEAALKAAGGE
jgi:hypothetical protein